MPMDQDIRSLIAYAIMGVMALVLIGLYLHLSRDRRSAKASYRRGVKLRRQEREAAAAAREATATE